MTISQVGARTNPNALDEDGECDHCHGQREKTDRTRDAEDLDSPGRLGDLNPAPTRYECVDHPPEQEEDT